MNAGRTSTVPTDSFEVSPAAVRHLANVENTTASSPDSLDDGLNYSVIISSPENKDNVATSPAVQCGERELKDMDSLMSVLQPTTLFSDETIEGKDESALIGVYQRIQSQKLVLGAGWDAAGDEDVDLDVACCVSLTC